MTFSLLASIFTWNSTWKIVLIVLCSFILVLSLIELGKEIVHYKEIKKRIKAAKNEPVAQQENGSDPE